MTEASGRRLRGAEDGLNVAILVLMAVLPLSDFVLRFFSTNVPGALRWVSVLTMMVGFTGGMLAAREGKHLALASVTGKLPPKLRRLLTIAALVVAVAVCLGLTIGAVTTVQAEAGFTDKLPPGLPGWVPLGIMPLAYAVIAVRIVLYGLEDWKARGLALGLGTLLLLGLYLLGSEASGLLWPALVVILAATVVGAPIFVALGGAALLFFFFGDEPIAAVAAETVRLTKSDTVPTIPLFTFTGYILAESKASERLVRAFRAMFGWMPGGMAVMTAGVCAFFTTFTGASGVTILALGGLLYPVLQAERYEEDFSIGLLTASGSIGLLFPPSLPIILYGVVAQVPIDRMFVAGILPGIVLVAAVALLGVRAGVVSGIPRQPFDLREMGVSMWEAKWELALPLVVVGSIFSGVAILIEAAALTAAYALFVEIVIHKDLKLKDLPKVGRECATLIGGVLVILGVALGFTNYLVDAEVPTVVLEWVRGAIESKWVFLIAVNVFLIIVGCLMDIFSAIVVVVPLILPISAHFGVDPIHMGIIFLANMELGFLTPPVGMNLFLSSFRFEKPLPQVYRATVPFLAILVVAVLVITYLPSLTMEPVEWVFGVEAEVAPVPEIDFDLDDLDDL
ncbi:MAG: TRAP transporter large permease subunit [Myxococcota bacterium]